MTGSLQEKNGMYQMVINTKDTNGKRKQKWISTGLTIKGNKRKAEQQLKEFLTEHAETGYIEPTKILFCDWVRDWVELQKPKLQATTYMNYIHLINRHVYPYFKALAIPLADIAPNAIQRYYNTKVEEGLNPNTVIKHHAVIRSALKYAVRSRLIKENPCDFVDKPKRKKYVAEFYNAEEIKQLLAVSKGTPIEVPIFIAAYFGLRRSEIAGLSWDRVDWTNIAI
jgi:integrase